MKPAPKWAGYAWAVAGALACTAAGLAMRPRFDLVNVAMVYLLAVVLVALRFSRGPAALAAVLCVAAFDFLFVPPEGAFTVEDGQYLLTFAIMLAVGLVVSGLVERTRAQAREQAALEMETETERIRSTLLASISHDLRTPLAVLTGASSSLVEAGERMAPQERQALARSLFEQSREMSERVSKVLQMTRLETGALRIERDWASVEEIVGAVLERLRDRLGAHRVLVELPADLPLVRVDAALVEQALANLLENAARHTPAGTVVRVRAACGDGQLVLSVVDYGGGLPAPERERVFRKFEHGSPEGASSGLGLGLAICRAIVRLHGGRAWADSVADGGISFHLALPAEAPPAPPEETT